MKLLTVFHCASSSIAVRNTFFFTLLVTRNPNKLANCLQSRVPRHIYLKPSWPSYVNKLSAAALSCFDHLTTQEKQPKWLLLWMACLSTVAEGGLNKCGNCPRLQHAPFVANTALNHLSLPLYWFNFTIINFSSTHVEHLNALNAKRRKYRAVYCIISGRALNTLTAYYCTCSLTVYDQHNEAI